MLFLCWKDLICKSNGQEEGRILGRQFELDEFLQNPSIMEEQQNEQIHQIWYLVSPILIVNRGGILSPTLNFNPTLVVIPCEESGGL